MAPEGFSYLSIVIRMDDIPTLIFEEHGTYPFCAFISDTGGILGLVLGLNIIGTGG